MRVRTWSACVVLAWGILLIITAAGPIGSLRPAQAATRTASSTSTTSTTSTTTTITTQVTLTSSVTSTLTSAPGAHPEAAVANPIARPIARPGARASTSARAGTGSYVVQPGDTLSGIASALGIPGGWPAVYAANRGVIGPDPGLIRPGTVLALPGGGAATRYTVGAGDTLSGIAAALGTPGGWPALYAANRRAIGPDPDAIRAGTMLTIPHPAPTPLPPSPASHPAPSASHAARPASTPTKAPAPAPSGGRQRPQSAHRPARATPPATAGLPRWLLVVLVTAGLLIATAFLTEPVLAIARRRRAARPAAAAEARIVLADYERLVVTHSRQDGTVYVLRPPGADPHTILLAARLVLAQDRYEALAGRLGVPAHWSRE
jgi:LysM repeat protein